MRVYRRNDKPIEALKFDGSQTSMFGYKIEPDSLVDADTGEPAYYNLLIEPLGDSEFPDEYTDLPLEIGDWVILDHAHNNTDYYRGISSIGEDEEFNNEYITFEDIPQVTDYIKDCKAKHKTLFEALNEKNLPDDTRALLFTDEEWVAAQDAFAQLWLLY